MAAFFYIFTYDSGFIYKVYNEYAYNFTESAYFACHGAAYRVL